MDSIDYEIIREFVKKQSLLDKNSIHGSEHWRYVERNGLLLAKMNGADETVIKLFALFHDSRRFDDSYDEKHGPRGAQLAKMTRGTLYDVTDSQYEMLINACEWHTTKRSTGVITIDTCFDADRLDLPRAGYIPNPTKMATPQGAKIATLGVKLGITLEDYRMWIDTIDVTNL